MSMQENEFFNSATILVVGGAGFVGSNLVKSLLENDPKSITIVDNLISSEMFNVPMDARVKMVYGSISDDSILEKIGLDFDFVFHLACFHGNQSSIVNPLEDHANNTFTSLKLFQHLSHSKTLKKVVYAAAACAVAEKTYHDASATTEDQPVSLYHDSPYSISKIIGELYGNYFWKRFDLPFVKARFSNAYGPREILGAGVWRGNANTVWRNVIPTFVWRAMHGDPLSLDNGGNNSRDFIFVQDMARGLMACAREGGCGEVYNLATGVETTILRIAELIKKLTKSDSELILGPARDWDGSGRRFASTDKSQNDLKFKSSVDIEEGLELTVTWYKENYDFIKSCIQKHEKMLCQ